MSKYQRMSLFERVIYGVESTKEIKRKGSISTVFTEAETEDIFKESTDLFKIREVGYEDVTSKHFIDWFFKLEDWVDSTPDNFPFSAITHNAENKSYVYGYFNGNKLDAMILVGEYDDNYELSFFCVNEAHQHEGIGQYLFTFILNKFRDKKMILYVYSNNKPAIHIYEKYGFRRSGAGFGRGYYPELQHLTMQKDAEKKRMIHAVGV